MALTDNLLAYYELENTDDSHGDNDLTNVNSVAFNTGKIGNAADFSSTNSNKILHKNSNLGITGGNITLSAWVKIATQPGIDEFQTIVRQSENTNKTHYNIGYHRLGGTYGLWFARSKNGVADEPIYVDGQLTTDTWYHVALTYDGTTLRSYKNTVSENRLASGNGTGSNPNYITIGAHYNVDINYFFPLKGLIDEVGIWSRALTVDEITALYNGGNGRTYPLALTNFHNLRRKLLMR